MISPLVPRMIKPCSRHRPRSSSTVKLSKSSYASLSTPALGALGVSPAAGPGGREPLNGLPPCAHWAGIRVVGGGLLVDCWLDDWTRRQVNG